MANIDNASGLKPHKNPHGGNGQATVTEHLLLATNAAIGIGSPVAVVTDGVDHASEGAGNALMGIAAEPKAASAGGTIKVWSDPNQLFVGQTDDGTGTATAAGAVGLNIDFINLGVQSGNANLSKAELDQSSAAAGATLQFKIIELSREFQGNTVNAHGEFNRYVVQINNHQLSGSTAGV